MVAGMRYRFKKTDPTKGFALDSNLERQRLNKEKKMNSKHSITPARKGPLLYMKNFQDYFLHALRAKIEKLALVVCKISLSKK